MRGDTLKRKEFEPFSHHLQLRMPRKYWGCVGHCGFLAKGDGGFYIRLCNVTIVS
jgi:hypothetical protein